MAEEKKPQQQEASSKQSSDKGDKQAGKTAGKDQPARVVQTSTVRAAPSKKISIEQMKALQAQRLEQAKALAEANAKAAGEAARRKEEAEERRQRLIENEKQKQVSKQKEEKMKASFSRFNFMGRKPQPGRAEPVPQATAVPTEPAGSSYKSPICCVLGHVDTGKTKLLDKLRETDVQGKEAGGITQQIGATFFPADMLARLCSSSPPEFPGILMIDTPGHETFSNLRSRGSSLCNLAILVVDLVHGLEQQTIESIAMLRQRRTPFIVALNKVDRLYDWEEPAADTHGQSVKELIEAQKPHTQSEFNSLLSSTIAQLAAQGINSTLFYQNDKPHKYVSLVPTSAITGAGIPDLIRLILRLCSQYMREKMLMGSDLECTVLEVKPEEGFGITLDAILSNGTLVEGARIGLSGTDGPIITTIKALLLPQPLRETRVKSPYTQVKSVSASVGVKIAALGLETAVAGSRIYPVTGDERTVQEAIEEDMAQLTSGLTRDDRGILVAASTLGSMEALLAFLRAAQVPVAGIVLGRAVKRKDLLRAAAMPDPQHRVLLCFNVPADEEAARAAGVKVFTAEIIYHLLDMYKKYARELTASAKEAYAQDATFPVELEIIPDCVFTTRSPLVLGVRVLRGTLKLHTPLCVFGGAASTGSDAAGAAVVCKIGRCASIREKNRDVQRASAGSEVAIKIEIDRNETPRVMGKHLQTTDRLYSIVSRKSINLLKEHFGDEIDQEHVELLFLLKRKFDII